MTTNLDLHRALLADPEFASGGVDTGYLARWLAARAPRNPQGHVRRVTRDGTPNPSGITLTLI